MAERELKILTSDPVYVSCKALKTAVYERVKKLEQLRDSLHKEVTNLILATNLSTNEEERLAETCKSIASLWISLQDSHNLNAQARRIETTVKYAASIEREYRELHIFLRSIPKNNDEIYYALSWEEADRFGL